MPVDRPDVMTLRLGIISTARINDMILQGAALTDRVDVVAVASRDGARAEAYARAHGIAQSFGSYDALLESSDVDAVYISLPNSMHVDWTVRSLEAGKHVLCEKPLTRHPADAERAVKAAADAGRVLMEAFMYRYNPQIARLLELVREGTIGRLLLIRSSLRYPVSNSADIRLDAALDGGSLMDLGCYCVHIARSLAGEPERIYAEQQLGPTGVEVAMQGTLLFADRVTAQFDSSFLARRHQELEVVGDGGSLRVPAPVRVDWGRPGIELRRDDGIESIAVEERDSYTLELDRFAAAASGVDPLPAAADAVGQARTVAALYESAERRLPVAVKP